MSMTARTQRTTVDELRSLSAPIDLARLHERLARAADREGLVDVAYRTVASPLGNLLVASTERGLVRVGLPNEDPEDVLGELADKVSPRVLAMPRRLDAAARQLDGYFNHRRTAFDVPLDLRLANGFRRAVLDVLSSIPYGSTASYGEVAAGVGRPAAVRAVGSACGANPLPIVVPCHRVVRSDGSLGGYRGGHAA
jgi:methylated-DNA-[protein]-cysteine S-methyltransferase